MSYHEQAIEQNFHQWVTLFKFTLNLPFFINYFAFSFSNKKVIEREKEVHKWDIESTRIPTTEL